MPKQKRWHIKRQLDQAVDACDKAQTYLVITAQDFETIHPDYYATFTAIVQGIESVKDAIKNLSDNI